METKVRKSSSQRIRACRERAAALGYQRMEITADLTTINYLRTVARVRNMPTYKALRQAVELLVHWHNAGGDGAKP